MYLLRIPRSASRAIAADRGRQRFGKSSIARVVREFLPLRSGKDLAKGIAARGLRKINQTFGGNRAQYAVDARLAFAGSMARRTGVIW